ncbi:MAG: glycoside hydrolase family 88 protein [Gallintestinimicrobium sp.]
MSQIQEMIKPAAAMLDTYPVVTTKQKIKQWIKTCVPGMTPEKVERYSWPQALLAMGLLQAYEQTKDKTALSSVFSYLRRWKNSGYPISHVDHVMNGSVALWTEEILTREKREDAESLEALWICREGADICAGWIKAAKKTADGILAYRSQHPDWLFADTLGMLCPFACRYGVQKQDKELLNLGIRQLELFFPKGMDEKTGLPYHGYDEKTGMKWNNQLGRACGWMLLGLSQSICGFQSSLQEQNRQWLSRAVSSLSVLPVCCPGGMQSSAFTAATAP